MKDYILDKIFVSIQDDIKSADSEYLSAKKKSYKIERKLLNSLPDNQKEDVKELIDNLIIISHCENKFNFCKGFKIGASLILEIMKI